MAFSARHPRVAHCLQSAATIGTLPGVPLLFCIEHRPELARWGAALGMATFLVAGAIIAKLRLPDRRRTPGERETGGSIRRKVAESIRFVRSHPVIRHLIGRYAEAAAEIIKLMAERTEWRAPVGEGMA